MQKHKHKHDGSEPAQEKSEGNNHKCKPQLSNIWKLLVNRKVLLSIFGFLKLAWKVWKFWQKIFGDNDLNDGE